MDTIIHIFPYAIALAMPLLVTSLGGLYSERSGVVNIGLEGLMVVGGFASAVFTVYLTPSLGPLAIWLSLAAAMILGALFSLLHAFASINLNANQVISGTAINMIAGAVTVFLARSITGSGNIQLTQGIPRFDIPGLVDLPIIGRLFFYQTYGTTWLILAILGLCAFLLYKTAFGLRLRACGENPHAADAAGINVYRVRYGAVMISGALAGLGGGDHPCYLLRGIQRLGGRHGLSRIGRAHLRPMEADRRARCHFLLRLCRDLGQCLASRAGIAGDSRGRTQSISLRPDLAGADFFLEIHAGAARGRRAF